MSLLTDLVAHWKLNEASGTRNDSHSGGHNLTDNNTVASATGKIGDAADFEAGNSEYLSVTDNASISFGADTPFTITFWAYFESVGGSFHPLLDKAGVGNGTGDEFLIDVEGGGWRAYVGNGSSFQSVTGSAGTTGTPTTGQWYFVVFWHDPVANTINLEVNNNGSIRSSAWSGGTQDGTASLLFGKYNTAGLYHDGLLDSVSYWHRVLTSDERTELYNSGNGLDYEDFGDGGTTYDETISETLSLTDSQIAAVTFLGSLAETLSLTDSQASTATFVCAQTEALSVSDSQVCSSSFVSSCVESLGLTDTASALGVFGANLNETLSLVDTQTSTAVLTAVLTETLSFVDVCMYQTSDYIYCDLRHSNSKTYCSICGDRTHVTLQTQNTTVR